MEILLNHNFHKNNLKLYDKYMKAAGQERKEQAFQSIFPTHAFQISSQAT